jgi:ubiquinone/menaquinone biosynthesis C-methylase UbiE
LDAAAATPVGVAYKRRLLAALEIRPGHAVVDVGCGPGTDLAGLADAVGDRGLVVGVDRDPAMLREAGGRLAAVSNTRLCLGDIHEVPLSSGSVDRARADRVIQHVLDPRKAIGEIHRVLRPGGLFGAAEPDWDTLAVADEDVETSRRFARFVAGRVRNPTIGRELPRLCADAGFRMRSIEPLVVLSRDFPTADLILGLRRNCLRAVDAGVMTETEATEWLHRQASGPLVASFTLYLVIAET